MLKTILMFDVFMQLYYAFYLIFFIGLLSLLFAERSFIQVLISLELAILGIAGVFLLHALVLNDITGQTVALVLLTLAGGESAIGLALFMVLYRYYQTTQLESLTQLRG
jgi:NADH:ubiquinone oxidoreductase subunit K